MRKPHTYWDEGVTLVSSCTPCSPGCERCWAVAIERRFKPEFKGQVQFHPDRLNRFNKKKPTVFSIWNDLFHANISLIAQGNAYQRMAINHQHTFLVLTKRPERMAAWDFRDSATHYKKTIPNIYLGLTVCNQQEADEKIPIFLQVPGKKFLSIEPMLGEVDITTALEDGVPTKEQIKDLHAMQYLRHGAPRIDAVILGCETGVKARPMQLEWARQIAKQCKAANVPLFIKALTINGKPNHNIEDWPEDLQIRELAW